MPLLDKVRICPSSDESLCGHELRIKMLGGEF